MIPFLPCDSQAFAHVFGNPYFGKNDRPEVCSLDTYNVKSHMENTPKPKPKPKPKSKTNTPAPTNPTPTPVPKPTPKPKAKPAPMPASIPNNFDSNPCFNPSLPDFLDHDMDLDNKIAIMEKYLSKYFIKVAGIYIEINNKGNLVPGKQRMVPKVFLKYLASFCCDWELCTGQIKAYQALICQATDIPDCYNTARALNYTIDRTPLSDKERDLIETFVGHLVTTCCQNDRTKTQHLIDMLALKIMYPFESITRIEQALVVIGEEGTGKTRFFNKLFVHLFGYNFVYTGTFATLTDRKNQHIADKLIYQIDDGGAKMRPSTAENMKRLITEPTINLRALYTDELPHDNYGMTIITANDWDRILIARTDRRYFVLEMATTHIGNLDYFRKLYAEIDEHSNLIVRWILSQYSNVGKLPPPPMTNTKYKAIAVHRSALEMFLKTDVENDIVNYYTDGSHKKYISVRDVLNRYKDTLERDDKPMIKQQDIGPFLSKYTTQVQGGPQNGKYYFETLERFNDFKRFLGVGVVIDEQPDAWIEQ